MRLRCMFAADVCIMFRAAPYEALTWHQPHCSTPWLQCLQKALLLSPCGGKERKKKKEDESKKERQGGRREKSVSIHKHTAYIRMDKMSLCVCSEYTHRSKTR